MLLKNSLGDIINPRNIEKAWVESDGNRFFIVIQTVSGSRSRISGISYPSEDMAERIIQRDIVDNW